MFRDIFNGKPPRLPFGNKSFLENAETTLEMHYITRSGSIEMMKTCDETDSVDGKSEEEKRWSEDPLTGKNKSLGHLLSFSCTTVRQYNGNFNILLIFYPITAQLRILKCRDELFLAKR